MAKLDDIRALQARARNKEYRLRKKGADELEVASASPRMDWAEVKAMSPQKRNAYAKRLEEFNARGNRLDVLESGEIVPHSVITETKRLADVWNAKAAEEKERLYRIAPDVRKKMERIRETRRRERGSVHGSLDKIEIKEPPKSRKNAYRRLETLKNMVEADFTEKRKGKRSNAVDMLRKMGYDEIASYVGSLSNDAFDYLSHSTAFWSMLEIQYAESLAMKQGKVMIEDTQSGKLADLAKTAKTAVNKPAAVQPPKPEYKRIEDPGARRALVRKMSASHRSARRSKR